MTTYYVDGNAGNDSADGSSNAPWKTIGRATEQAKSGDEVRIRTATYREIVRLRTDNTTWKADTGHTPVIDGGYHEGLFRADGTLPHPDLQTAFLPDQVLGSMVSLSATGVVLDGLTVQNVAGTAISVSESRCIVRNCRIDFTYGTAIRVSPVTYIDNVLIENNVSTRISVRYYDPLRTGGGPESVSGVIRVGRARDCIVRNNICAYGHGEGINLDKAGYRTLVEGNIVHTCNHVHIYINRTIDAVIRNNLVYHLYLDDFVGEDGRPPAGIAIGDELGGDGSWPYSAGGQIYNNIVVGLGALLSIRNNARSYNTQLDNCYIGYNTFIGGAKTVEAVAIAGNMQGRPHRPSLIENNIFHGGQQISKANGDLSAIAFRNNLWGEQPAAAMRGPGDRIGNPNLANPTAELRGKFPDAASSIDPRNYQ
ncbi:right-handed parallel beta-helix repeat-containing protein, partial [Promineifilum sp.]|uniref:right-handed parallel beta-helix repeat-containing protein n=1 Tax=Promineifilum sp. TaxID=2664178 RepID=UPI0035B0F994